MAERVDKESGMLDDDDAEDAGNQESAEGAGPAIPEESEKRGKCEADDESDPVAVSMLPHNETIFFEVGDIVSCFGAESDQEPSDVSPEETAGDTVGVVIFVIGVFMMSAVIGDPIEGGVFEGAGAEDKGGEADGGFGLKGPVGEEPMVAEGNAHAGSRDVKEEKSDLEPIESKVPEVKRRAEEGDEKRSDKKRTRGPVNPCDGKAVSHIIRNPRICARRGLFRKAS